MGGASRIFPPSKKHFAKEVGNFPSQPGKETKREGAKYGTIGTKENFGTRDPFPAQNEDCEKAVLPLVRKPESRCEGSEKEKRIIRHTKNALCLSG